MALLQELGGFMKEIRYVKNSDKTFWYSLDKHLLEEEFDEKLRRNMGYIILNNGIPVGLLRYNLFWDNIPFCTMLFIDHNMQKKGYGKDLLLYWENDMAAKGYGITMVSTQADEYSQHFYRKYGYQDAGGLLINIPGYAQPMEIFMIKKIKSVL